MHPIYFLIISLLVFTVQTSSRLSWGSTLILQKSWVEEALSESVPTALPLEKMDIPDFRVRWEGEKIEGVKFRLAPGTIQWVRVSEVLVVPRARLILDLDGLEGGLVSHGGFTHAFQSKEHAEIPVALISGEKNPISLVLKKNGKTLRGTLFIEYGEFGKLEDFEQLRPNQKGNPQNPRIYLDASCSPYQISITPIDSAIDPSIDPSMNSVKSWIYAGCRLVRVEGEGHKTPSLEVFMLWDNVGQTLQVNGIPAPSSSPSVWSFRLAPEPGQVQLQAGKVTLKLEYHVPKILHNTSVSMGLGPYAYSFRSDGVDFNTVVPLVTLYGSYFVTESIRVVGFGATTIDSHHLTDLGIYLYFEYNRFWDRRVTLNLLVGGHGISFGVLGQTYFVPSLPQGFELAYSDAFARGKSLKLGAFIYPLISNSSYYNVWLRWGAQWFIEANYISWQLQPHSTLYNTSNIGLSVGFPLFQLW